MKVFFFEAQIISAENPKKWMQLLCKEGNTELSRLFLGYLDSTGEFTGEGNEARWWTDNSAKTGSTRYYYHYSITTDSVTWNPSRRTCGYRVRCFETRRVDEEDIYDTVAKREIP